MQKTLLKWFRRIRFVSLIVVIVFGEEEEIENYNNSETVWAFWRFSFVDIKRFLIEGNEKVRMRKFFRVIVNRISESQRSSIPSIPIRSHFSPSNWCSFIVSFHRHNVPQNKITCGHETTQASSSTKTRKSSRSDIIFSFFTAGKIFLWARDVWAGSRQKKNASRKILITLKRRRGELLSFIILHWHLANACDSVYGTLLPPASVFSR